MILSDDLINFKEMAKKFNGVFPIVVVARYKKGTRYTSDNFKTIYTDLLFTDLEKTLIE